MHGKLSQLRFQLRSLQRQRALVRSGSVLCTVTLLAVGLWTLAFVFDVSLRLSFGSRLLMLVGWIAAVAWCFYRAVWPALTRQETVEDLALLVEQNHAIDSDLISALQFESPAAQSWGSPRLASAVIDQVAGFSPELNVFKGFTSDPLPRRFAAVLFTLMAFLLSAALFPGHVSAFWNRFWLGSARYPSQTIISEVVVNGQEVSPRSPGQLAELRLPQGSPLHIRIRCAGQLPKSAAVRLQSQADRAEVQFDLKPAPGEPFQFAAEHALPANDVRLQVFAGDTWSDPVSLQVVPLPMLDVQWQVTEPAYAATAAEQRSSDTARFLSVLAGSKLQIAVRSTNKRLRQVDLRWGEQVLPLVASSDPTVWMLPSGSPLDSIQQSETYTVHAVDVDGLSVTPPVAGNIRLKPDRAPRVVSAIVTKLVVPTAKPTIAFGATDDYGLSQVRVQIEVARATGESEKYTNVLWQGPARSPAPTMIRDEARLDLKPFQLETGDEVRVTVEAADDRGELEPQVATGETLLLKVTDRSGILSGLNESDQLTVKQLDTIILRELGIGGDSR